MYVFKSKGTHMNFNNHELVEAYWMPLIISRGKNVAFVLSFKCVYPEGEVSVIHFPSLFRFPGKVHDVEGGL